MANTQEDFTPSTAPGPGIHFHSPTGQTASVVNNPADFPAVPANVGTGSKTVTTKVTGTQGSQVRFSNPA
jgi:hypothetical protein